MGIEFELCIFNSCLDVYQVRVIFCKLFKFSEIQAGIDVKCIYSFVIPCMHGGVGDECVKLNVLHNYPYLDRE